MGGGGRRKWILGGGMFVTAIGVAYYGQWVDPYIDPYYHRKLLRVVEQRIAGGGSGEPSSGRRAVRMGMGAMAQVLHPISQETLEAHVRLLAGAAADEAVAGSLVREGALDQIDNISSSLDAPGSSSDLRAGVRQLAVALLEHAPPSELDRLMRPEETGDWFARLEGWARQKEDSAASAAAHCAAAIATRGSPELRRHFSGARWVQLLETLLASPNAVDRLDILHAFAGVECQADVLPLAVGHGALPLLLALAGEWMEDAGYQHQVALAVLDLAESAEFRPLLSEPAWLDVFGRWASAGDSALKSVTASLLEWLLLDEEAAAALFREFGVPVFAGLADVADVETRLRVERMLARLQALEPEQSSHSASLESNRIPDSHFFVAEDVLIDPTQVDPARRYVYTPDWKIL